MSSRTTRRRFVVVTTGVGAAALLSPRALRTLWPNFTEPLEQRLSGLFGDAESARMVGMEYLRAAREETSVETLVRFLSAGVEGGRRTLEATSDDQLRVLLAQRTRHDFASGETVELQGWILSRTEARVSAIAALIGGGR